MLAKRVCSPNFLEDQTQAVGRRGFPTDVGGHLDEFAIYSEFPVLSHEGAVNSPHLSVTIIFTRYDALQPNANRSAERNLRKLAVHIYLIFEIFRISELTISNAYCSP